MRTIGYDLLGSEVEIGYGLWFWLNGPLSRGHILTSDLNRYNL
jgi:hypothetical protein